MGSRLISLTQLLTGAGWGLTSPQQDFNIFWALNRYQAVLEAPPFSALSLIAPNPAFTQAPDVLRADLLCVHVIPKFRSDHVLEGCTGRYSQHVAGEESWVKGTAMRAVHPSNISKGDAFTFPFHSLRQEWEYSVMVWETYFHFCSYS